MESVGISYRDLGLIDYKECWDLQQGLFDGLVAAKTTDVANAAAHTLLLCEHPHVYTLGKSGHKDNMLITPEFMQRIGATFYLIDRGGDITYHGPGQLVGYPVLDLEKLGVGLKEYVHGLEQAIIETVGEFGIKSGRSEGATGVWLQQDAKGGLRKISAIGVRSSRFVTMHGFSLNVAPQMEYFSYINPCGFTDRGVTSMAAELGEAPAMESVKRVFAQKFEKIFNVTLAFDGADTAGANRTV